MRVDPVSGQPREWTLDGIRQESAAFGLAGKLRGDRLFVAVGGSDFTGAYGAAGGTPRVEDRHVGLLTGALDLRQVDVDRGWALRVGGATGGSAMRR